MFQKLISKSFFNGFNHERQIYHSVAKTRNKMSQRKATSKGAACFTENIYMTGHIKQGLQFKTNVNKCFFQNGERNKWD